LEISITEAVILGLVQGLTEFLPISSSGHLVIMQHFLGIQEAILTFDVMLHLGTLVAVFIVFWGDIKAILKKPFDKISYLIIVGTVPAVLMGLTLEDIFSQLFGSVVSVGFALLVTGALLWISDRFHGMRESRHMSYFDAVLIGLFQGIAITPGISRSGSTIVGALWRGLNRESAAKFSFLLSIPIILGAGGKELLDVYKTTGGIGMHASYIWGMMVAALSGYVAIKIFLKLVERSKLRYFSYYCWIIGIAVLLISLVF